MAETKRCGEPTLHLMLLGLMAFFLVSCHWNETKPYSQWTEAQKRNYFVDSFAYVTGSGKYFELVGQDSGKLFGSFIRHQYPDLHTTYYMDPLPYALEEEYIDTTRIDSSREWIRFIVYSFFDLPYSLVLERRAGRTYLTTKLTDGQGLYHTGQLILTSKQVVPDSLTESVFRTIDSLNFWRLQGDTSCHGGTDGSEWSIEAILHAKYNRVERWAPEGCGDSVTRKLAELGNQLAAACDLPTLIRACDKRRPGLTIKRR
jgi:hypothetical protein